MEVPRSACAVDVPKRTPACRAGVGRKLCRPVVASPLGALVMATMPCDLAGIAVLWWRVS